MGGESHLLLLASPPLTSLPQLVRGLRTPDLVVLGRTISDQDLLRHCSDAVFEHRIFVCPSKQVIHRCRPLLCERLKEWRAWVDTSFEDLQDGIPIARFHLETTCLNHFMKSLSDSVSCSLMFCMLVWCQPD